MSKQIAILAVLLLGVYLLMTPKGALRLGIAVAGYPIKAITSVIVDKSYPFYSAENQIGYSLQNPPYEKETHSELINWNVKRYGIFYIAEYFGYG
ncbi:MAG: hypothetical protein RSF90_02450 [Pygmaiobacter sp.]